MDFKECVQGRRSIRKFESTPVTHAQFEELVSLASYAPSWKNSQTARYIFIEDAALKEKIADECVLGFTPNANGIKAAPALIVVATVTGRSGFERDGSFSTSKEDRWEVFDAGLATGTLCLAAHSMGLGTVIMGIFDEQKLAETINLPEGQSVAALVPIGVPAEAPAMPKRKDVADLASYR